MAARKRALWWTAMVVAGAATLAPPAGAATVTVTRTDDPLPTDGCATNGCSLREAVSAANLGDRVHLPASAEPYTLSDGAGSGPIVIGKDLTVDGDGAGASTISGNAAHRAFNVLSGAAAITVAISDLTIRDGRGGDAPVANQGGAIVVNPTTQPIALNLTAVHLRDNAVTTSAVASYSSGGALSVLGDTGAAGSTITIASSALFGNVAEAGSTSNALGGAIAITVNNAATLNLVNSTLSGNQARIIGTGEGRGGGIALLEDVDGDVQVNLRNSTIAANLANTFNGVGGNLYGEGSSTLSASATIVSGGDAVDPTSDNCKAASIPGNNVENENECGVGAAGKPSSDPQPGPLQDNGGPTSTRAISASSPAIGLGTAASCQAVDQRGVPRPSGGCDAGAFEGAPPGVVTGAATGVFTSVATLNGSVSPFFAAATHQFQYGPTAAYGSTTPVRSAGAVFGPLAATEPVTGLVPGLTYHYRLTAGNAYGSTPGPDATFTTVPIADPPPPPPVPLIPVESLTLAPYGFVAEGSGPSARAAATALVRFALRTAAPVRFAVEVPVYGRRVGRVCRAQTRLNRTRPRCIRRWSVVAGSFVRTGQVGSNRFRLTGRMAGRKLVPRAYRLVAQARNSANRLGPRRTRAFRILAPRRR